MWRLCNLPALWSELHDSCYSVIDVCILAIWPELHDSCHSVTAMLFTTTVIQWQLIDLPELRTELHDSFNLMTAVWFMTDFIQLSFHDNSVIYLTCAPVRSAWQLSFNDSYVTYDSSYSVTAVRFPTAVIKRQLCYLPALRPNLHDSCRPVTDLSKRVKHQEPTGLRVQIFHVEFKLRVRLNLDLS